MTQIKKSEIFVIFFLLKSVSVPFCFSRGAKTVQKGPLQEKECKKGPQCKLCWIQGLVIPLPSLHPSHMEFHLGIAPPAIRCAHECETQVSGVKKVLYLVPPVALFEDGSPSVKSGLLSTIRLVNPVPPVSLFVITWRNDCHMTVRRTLNCCISCILLYLQLIECAIKPMFG